MMNLFGPVAASLPRAAALGRHLFATRVQLPVVLPRRLFCRHRPGIQVPRNPSLPSVVALNRPNSETLVETTCLSLTNPREFWRLAMRNWKLISVLILAPLALLPAAVAQSVTGQISGVVVDPAGAVVPSAPVQLTHDLSKTVHRFTTESNGSFVFTGLVPGDYSLRVTQPGFKVADQRGITVEAQERVDLHEIHLEVGELTNTVTVQADAVHVDTNNSDR